jgi:hypothetical protein
MDQLDASPLERYAPWSDDWQAIAGIAGIGSMRDFPHRRDSRKPSELVTCITLAASKPILP